MAIGRRGLFKSFFLKEDLTFKSLVSMELHFLGSCYLLFEERISTPGSSELKIPDTDAFPVLGESSARPQVVLVSHRTFQLWVPIFESFKNIFCISFSSPTRLSETLGLQGICIF